MSKSADAFRTISEVAEWLDTPAHVLRFWESKFSQVKPVKRAGGRRYYRPQDMMLLGGIKKLLHDDGMTIKHVQKLLRQDGVKHVAAMSAHPADAARYMPVTDDAAPDPEPEISRIVSFRTEPDVTPEAETTPEPAQEPTPVAFEDERSDRAPVSPLTSPQPEPTDPPAPSSEGRQPLPSFLSGGKDMPQPDTTPSPGGAVASDAQMPSPTPDLTPDPTPDPTPAPPIEPVPDPTPHIDVFSMLSGRRIDDIQARQAELRPILDRIRAQLTRLS